METAKRLEGIGEYYFSKKLQEIQELNKGNTPVINLGIGSPDMPPHPDVIQTLQRESLKPNVHGYQNYKGCDALRKAFSTWYLQYYQVDLDPFTEILPLIGSKEGIMHICMTYLDKGDKALIPDPGYPTYSSAVQLAGGSCLPYELKENDDWSIDFEALENQDLARVKLMWVNYPQMPTGQRGNVALFEKIVGFGKKHNILICHDNPYSFILNDHPKSLLSINGAKDVVIELNSLSKSHNMAGWRIGVLVGNARRIEEVLRFKSNMDSGMFLPLQLAAVTALSLNGKWFEQLNEVYNKRKEKALELLDLLKCTYSKAQSGLFVWAKIPKNYSDCYEISDEVLYNTKIFITPGSIFGSAGARYVRVSLCSPESNYDLAIQRIKTYMQK